MWLSRIFSASAGSHRGAVLLLATLLLAAPLLGGCGFEPLYAKHATGRDVQTQLAQIRVGLIRDRIGQQLRNHLLDRVNPNGEPGNPRYSLAVELTVSRTDLGIERDETATRAKLTLSANFQLTDLQTRKTVLTATAQSVNSFNIVDSDFATQNAENDARNRAARDLSEEITTRLGLFLNRYEG